MQRAKYEMILIHFVNYNSTVEQNKENQRVMQMCS